MGRRSFRTPPVDSAPNAGRRSCPAISSAPNAENLPLLNQTQSGRCSRRTTAGTGDVWLPGDRANSRRGGGSGGIGLLGPTNVESQSDLIGTLTLFQTALIKEGFLPWPWRVRRPGAGRARPIRNEDDETIAVGRLEQGTWLGPEAAASRS